MGCLWRLELVACTTQVLVKSLGFKDEDGRAQFMTDPAARLHEPEASGLKSTHLPKTLKPSVNLQSRARPVVKRS